MIVLGEGFEVVGRRFTTETSLGYLSSFAIFTMGNISPLLSGTC